MPGRTRPRDCPGFVRFWAASTVSDFGTYVTPFAVQVLVVVTLHGSATDVGVVNAARFVPYLLFGLLVGVLVDRCRRRPVLVVSDLIAAAALVAVPALAFTHRLGLVSLVVVMLVYGTLSLVNGAAFMSFLPRLVPTSLLTASNARLDQSMSVAQTTGPALAGGLIGLIGAPLTVLVDAGSYVASGLLVSTIVIDEPRRTVTHPRHRLRAELREGLAWVYRHRTLAPMAVTTHLWFLFSGLLGAVFVPFAITRLHLSSLGVGVVLAFAGVGGLSGSLVSTRLGRRYGVGPVVIASNLLLVPALAAIAVAPSSSPVAAGALLAVGQLLIGLTIGVANANEMGYRQAVTPDGLQGRTNTTMRSLNRAALVVGGPLGGLLADLIGYRAAVWIAAAGFATVAVAQAASPFRRASFADAVSD